MSRSFPVALCLLVAFLLAPRTTQAQTQSTVPSSDADWRYHLSIHDIARADDDQKLSQLVSDNPDRVLVRLADGRTAAHVAAEVGALKSLRVLAKAGADLNVTDNSNRTPLSIAISLHFTATVKTLIELGVNVNRNGVAEPAGTRSDSDGADASLQLPLSIAARRGCLDVAKLLLDANADVNKINPDKSTPLTVAASSGNWDVALLLLDRGANVNAADASGMTALLYAAASSDEKQVAMLLARGANPRLTDKQGRSALSLTRSAPIWKMLVEKGADVDLVVGGLTPLQYFITEGNLDLVRIWLDFKPDPFIADRKGLTAKELAKKHAAGQGYGPRQEIFQLVEAYQKRYAAEQVAHEQAATRGNQ